MDFPGLTWPELKAKNAKTLKEFITNLIQNSDVAKSNTLYQFVNLDDKKFSNFKKLKNKEKDLGKKLKIFLKLKRSGVSKKVYISEINQRFHGQNKNKGICIIDARNCEHSRNRFRGIAEADGQAQYHSIEFELEVSVVKPKNQGQLQVHKKVRKLPSPHNLIDH